uniref:Uncharacterized protein n=1 Tax=Anolis carolinensis TaxID=28377 RepID=A0A803TSE7_ANOCA
MRWDLNEGKHLYTPNHYWLCAATGPSIKIWVLQGMIIVDELKQEVISTSSKAEPPQQTLFSKQQVRQWWVTGI